MAKTTVLPLTGGILTGGLARRLQSIQNQDVDKGLIDLAGQPLVSWSAKKLRPYTKLPLLISANRNHPQYEKYGQVVDDPDYLPSYQGPLAGILAMLLAAKTEWLMVLPVDSPFVPNQLIVDLWQAHLAQPQKRAFFVQHERTYPLFLLIHTDCAPTLESYLQADQRRVQGWLEQQDAVAVDLRHYAEQDFFNINEPADVQRAHILINNPSA